MPSMPFRIDWIGCYNQGSPWLVSLSAWHFLDFSLSVSRKSESVVLVAQSCSTPCEPTGLLHLWDSEDRNTGVGWHFLFQVILPTQGSNPGLPHCRQTLYHLSYQGSRKSRTPQFLVCFYFFFPKLRCSNRGVREDFQGFETLSWWGNGKSAPLLCRQGNCKKNSDHWFSLCGFWAGVWSDRQHGTISGPKGVGLCFLGQDSASLSPRELASFSVFRLAGRSGAHFSSRDPWEGAFHMTQQSE